jgi:hypothetical protein
MSFYQSGAIEPPSHYITRRFDFGLGIGTISTNLRSCRFLGEMWYPSPNHILLEETTIRYPISDLLNPEECYDYLLHVLYPEGSQCKNGHPLPPDQAPHDRSRAPLVDYRCRVCGNVFNLFTDSVWEGTHYDCITVVLVMRGFVQGMPTLQLAEELGLDYGTLLERRHQIQQLALVHKPTEPLPDEVVEADEMFQTPVKRAKNARTQTTHRAAEPTIGLDWARWTVIAHPFWASWGVPPVIVSQSVIIHNKSRSNHRLNRILCPVLRCTLTKVRPTITSLHRDAPTPPFVIPATSMPATMMVTASVKSTAIPRKASGPDSATSYACFVVCTRNTWRPMSSCLHGPISSSESPLIS